MIKATEKLLESQLSDRVFSWFEIEHLFHGTAASRYALLNKALKKREVIKLKRGSFILAKKYQKKPLNRYYIASQMALDSYISTETALAFHQWIPEQVMLVISVVATGRNRQFKTPVGDFHYYHIPINDYQFFRGVSYERENRQSFLMASPLRALCDLIYVKKIHYPGIDFLEKSLRIDRSELESIDSASISQLQQVYRSSRVQHFLKTLRQELCENE